jgi:alkylation response protein AidB-like acyl-CoA dehydrogenase
MIWARDVADNQVKGFIVENKTTPGFSVEKIEHKVALKVVQKGQITLKDVRISEASRLQGGNSFRDTVRVLRMTRYMVGWASTGIRWARASSIVTMRVRAYRRPSPQLRSADLARVEGHRCSRCWSCASRARALRPGSRRMAKAMAARTEHIRRVASVGDIGWRLCERFHAVQWGGRLPGGRGPRHAGGGAVGTGAIAIARFFSNVGSPLPRSSVHWAAALVPA